MNKKVIIAAGGTGGHLFPALAFAEELQNITDGKLDVTFVAKGLKDHAHFPKEKFSFHDISAGALSKHPIKLLKNCLMLSKGLLQSIKILRKEKPACVIGFGSYHTVPILAAASLLSIPIVLHESNRIPGKVVKLFSRKAAWTGVFFKDAKEHLSGNARHVNIPLRKQFLTIPGKQEALQYYGLSDKKKTLLIFGGSQGAQGINKLVFDALPFLDNKNIQILHFTGGDKSVKTMYERFSILAIVKDFEPYMHNAWAIADLAICRSGAVTIAEQLHAAVPALFIPYPHAADNHQEHNARFIAEVIHGGRVCKEQNLTGQKLALEITHFLDEDALSKAKQNLSLYAVGRRDNSFCHEVAEFLRII